MSQCRIPAQELERQELESKGTTTHSCKQLGSRSPRQRLTNGNMQKMLYNGKEASVFATDR